MRESSLPPELAAPWPDTTNNEMEKLLRLLPDLGHGKGLSNASAGAQGSDNGPLSRLAARLAAAHGLQCGHGRGASLSKPSIRVTSSHWPHQGGRAGRCGCGGGSSAGESRAANTAYGLRTPAVFAPVNAASACGDQPAWSAAWAAGASRARWSAVSLQPSSRTAKNSSTAWPRPAVPAVVGTWRVRGGGGRFHGWFPDGSGATAAPRSCACCTPPMRRLHPVRGSGCNCCTRSGRLSTASLSPDSGCGDCTPVGLAVSARRRSRGEPDA